MRVLRQQSHDMTSDSIPSYVLLTDDKTELLRPEAKSLGEALRYTDNRFRGLFGGIWRAEVARAAFAFATPIAEELGGSVHLGLAGEGEDRHVLHFFLPVSNVMNRFTPWEWFAFWKAKDAAFTATARLTDSAEPV